MRSKNIGVIDFSACAAEIDFFESIDSFSDDKGVVFLARRTALGNEEMKRRHLDLSGSTLRLLEAFDRQRPLESCLAATAGASMADAMILHHHALLELRLICRSQWTVVEEIEWNEFVARVLSLPSDRLYTFLTEQAKLRLGLIQGFRLILALERCRGPHEQAALALRFVLEMLRRGGFDALRALDVSARDRDLR